MIELAKDIIFWAIIGTGFLAILAGLSYLSWRLIEQIIKLAGYWPLFYKTLMAVARERNKK